MPPAVSAAALGPLGGLPSLLQPAAASSRGPQSPLNHSLPYNNACNYLAYPRFPFSLFQGTPSQEHWSHSHSLLSGLLGNSWHSVQYCPLKPMQTPTPYPRRLMFFSSSFLLSIGNKSPVYSTFGLSQFGSETADGTLWLRQSVPFDLDLNPNPDRHIPGYWKKWGKSTT